MSNYLSRRQIIKVGVGLVTGTAASGSVPLIANLIASSALVSRAQAQTNGFDGLVSVSLESGTIISFECLGDTSNPSFKYLDGRTADGTVGLAPSVGGEFTGTRWRVDRRQSTSGEIYYTFYCLGTIPGSNYLDGRTGDGTVGLAPSDGTEYTGARWMVYSDGSSFLFYCLGNVDGPRWLDGRTGDGSVGLAPNYNGVYTGTKWRLKILQTNRFDGLVSVSLESGTIISLDCLGDTSNPSFKYLDGRTADGTVGLAPSVDGGFTGTKWRIDRRQSTSEEIYYTFYCLGAISGSNYLDGRTGNGTVGLAQSYGTGIYTGARWMVYSDGSSFLFYCLGNVDGPKWLDGRTGDGSVGLAPDYNGVYTGTKWRLVVVHN